MEKYYNLQKTADILGVKVRTMRDWVKKGKIKAIKYSGSNIWLISETEINKFIHSGVENDNKD